MKAANWSDKTAEFLRPYGKDYENSIQQGIPEFYGQKFQAMYSDGDVRIAFGKSYPREQQDGTLLPETRYEAAVYMPYETVRSLVDYLSKLMADYDAAKSAAQ